MSPNRFTVRRVLPLAFLSLLATACDGSDDRCRPGGVIVAAQPSVAAPMMRTAMIRHDDRPPARRHPPTTRQARVFHTSDGALARITPAANQQQTATNITLSDRPYALAINECGIMYAPRLDAASAARFELPATNPTGHVSVGSIPTDVSFDRSGTRAFVSNQGGSVSVIDVAGNTVAHTIPVPDRAFVSLTSPNDDRLYIGSAIGKVYVYDLGSRRFTDSITVGDVPQHLTFHPDGIRLYVSMRDLGRVTEIDTRTHTITRTFNSTYGIQEAVVAPDGSELYVANQSGWLEVWNLGSGTRDAEIPLGDGPWAMTLSPDQSKLYVGILFSGEVAVVNRVARTVDHYLDVGGIPRRIKFAPDNTTIVIANEDGYVTFLR